MGLAAARQTIPERNCGQDKDGKTGYLAETVDDFVEACRKLLRDPQLRSGMATRARQAAVESFAIEHQIEKLESLYSAFV